MANAAHFGLPQQRNRAWLMCVLESEAPKDEHMARDVFLFQCEPLPISSCLEPAMQASEQRKQRKGTTSKGEVISEPKWKACFEEQCKIYGKVDLALPGSTFLVNCWGLCFSTPKFSSSAAIMMLTVPGEALQAHELPPQSVEGWPDREGTCDSCLLHRGSSDQAEGGSVSGPHVLPGCQASQSVQTMRERPRNIGHARQVQA